MRKVPRYTGAEIVEEACVRVPIARKLVEEDGMIRDEEIRSSLRAALDALVAHVRLSKPPHDGGTTLPSVR